MNKKAKIFLISIGGVAGYFIADRAITALTKSESVDWDKILRGWSR